MRRGFKRAESRRPRQGGTFTLPIPTGGWNTRDELSKLDPIYAQDINNLYVEDGRLTLRKGTSTHATGLQSDVTSIMAYRAAAVERIFAASGAQIRDVTAGGASSSVELQGLANARFGWTNFAAGGNQFLFIANGADTPRRYDGSSWSTPSITGPASPTTLAAPFTHKGRIWMIQSGSLSLWYLGVSAIDGAANELDLGPLCRRGGRLVAGGTWTRDGGAGLDDYLAAITSKGEVVIYQGTDPSTLGSWALVGVYQIPEPLGGHRCVAQGGADLYILTKSGVITLSDVLEGYPRIPSMNYNIEPSFNAASARYPNSSIWEVLWDSSRNRVIVNVPALADEVEQYVYSPYKSAWQRITGRNARSWVESGGNLYFGSKAGVVKMADSGSDDDGEPIYWDVTFAPSEYGLPGIKHWKRGRVHFSASATITPTVAMISDYKRTSGSTTAVTPVTVNEGAVWNVGVWNKARWGGVERVRSAIVNLNGSGSAGALRVAGSSKVTSVRISGAEISLQVGREL